MTSYTIGLTVGIGPYNIASSTDPLPSGCFCRKIPSVSSFSGKMPLPILFVRIFIAPLIFPFCLRFLNLFNIVIFLFANSFGNGDCKDPASSNKFLISPLCHCFNRHSIILTWSLVLELFEGFWRSKASIIWITFIDTSFNWLFST